VEDSDVEFGGGGHGADEAAVWRQRGLHLNGAPRPVDHTSFLLLPAGGRADWRALTAGHEQTCSGCEQQRSGHQRQESSVMLTRRFCRLNIHQNPSAKTTMAPNG